MPTKQPARDLTTDIAPQPSLEERLQRGMMEYSAKQYHDAKNTFARLTHDYPFMAHLWVHLGNAEYRLRGFLLAEKAWKEALKLDPMEVDTYLNLGSLLVEQQRFDEALYYWRVGLQLDEKNKAIWLNLAELYKKKRQPLKCFQTQQRYMEMVGPRDNDAQKINRRLTQGFNAYKPNVQIAHIALKQNNLDHARRAFDKALEYYIGTYKDHKTYGAVLYKMERIEEAERAYWNALALNDNDPKVYANLGIILEKQKRLVDATWAYVKATRLDPDNMVLQDKLMPRINKLVAAINNGKDFETYLAKARQEREKFDLETAKDRLIRLQDLMPHTEKLQETVEEEMYTMAELFNLKDKAQQALYQQGEEALERDDDEASMYFFLLFIKHFPDDPMSEELEAICKALEERIAEKRAEEAEANNMGKKKDKDKQKKSYR